MPLREALIEAGRDPPAADPDDDVRADRRHDAGGARRAARAPTSARRWAARSSAASITSTLLTLLVIPTFYEILTDWRDWLGARLAPPQSAAPRLARPGPRHRACAGHGVGSRSVNGHLRGFRLQAEGAFSPSALAAPARTAARAISAICRGAEGLPLPCARRGIFRSVFQICSRARAAVCSDQREPGGTRGYR